MNTKKSNKISSQSKIDKIFYNISALFYCHQHVYV